MFLGGENGNYCKGLFDDFNLAGVGKLVGGFDRNSFARSKSDMMNNCGGGGKKIKIKFTLEAFLNNF